MFKKKQENVTFYNIQPSVAELYPIVPANKIKHEWKDLAAKEFNRNKSKCPFSKLTSVSRCPGINDIQSLGWIITLSQDVTITQSDGNIMLFPADESSDMFGFHTREMYHQFRKHWPHNTHPDILKVKTGWVCEIPKNHKLLQLNPFHSDENRFTTIEGVYDSNSGPIDLAIPMYWHEQQPTTLLAGTPIAQLVLIPDTKYDFDIVEINDTIIEKMRIKGSQLNRKFIISYNSIKSFWKSK